MNGNQLCAPAEIVTVPTHCQMHGIEGSGDDEAADDGNGDSDDTIPKHKRYWKRECFGYTTALGAERIAKVFP